MTRPIENLIRGVVTQAVTRIAEFNRDHRRADGPNPYLSGIHQPMTAEFTLTDLAVSGTESRSSTATTAAPTDRTRT